MNIRDAIRQSAQRARQLDQRSWGLAVAARIVTPEQARHNEPDTLADNNRIHPQGSDKQ